MDQHPNPAAPDDKDWTWTLERACPDCGFDATLVRGPDVADLTLAATRPWAEVLAREDVDVRPDPTVWSPLEYAGHVRDVCRVFSGRVALMRAEDDPVFENWDQDASAVEGEYWSADPLALAAEIEAAATALAASFATTADEAWARTGRRSNGSGFTIESLGAYLLHDLLHHLHDVGAPLPTTARRG